MLERAAELIETLRHIPKDAPAMDVLRSAVSLLAHWDPEAADNSHEANIRKAERLLAQFPVAICEHFRAERGEKAVAARPDGVPELAPLAEVQLGRITAPISTGTIARAGIRPGIMSSAWSQPSAWSGGRGSRRSS